MSGNTTKVNMGATAMINPLPLAAFASQLSATAQHVEELTAGLSSTIDNGLDEYGQAIVEAIRSRTLSGLDVHGVPFAPYSYRYEKFKGSKRVNLKLSGAMLSAIEFFNLGDGRGEVRINEDSRGREISNNALALMHQRGERHMPKRQFFGWIPGSEHDGLLMQELEDKLNLYLKINFNNNQ